MDQSTVRCGANSIPPSQFNDNQMHSIVDLNESLNATVASQLAVPRAVGLWEEGSCWRLRTHAIQCWCEWCHVSFSTLRCEDTCKTTRS